VPVYFGSWWIVTEANTDIHTAPDDTSAVTVHIPKSRGLLVIAPHLDDWLRVYDPVTRKKGFISDEKYADTAPDSDTASNDPVLERLENAPVDWPSVIKANHWIRIATWGLFAMFGLLAAWKTTDFDRFLFWAATALLVSYFLIMTQMWPWYIIWALAFGALNVGKPPARLAMLLSMGVLTLYVTIGYAASGDYEWIYTFRSLPAVVLPALLFLAGMRVARLLPARAKRLPGLADAGA
jgi:hypothetical protein